jgi:hypothetical protein
MPDHELRVRRRERRATLASRALRHAITTEDKKIMKSSIKLAFAAASSVVVLGSALAQAPAKGPGLGPVITQSKDDIVKFCNGKSHDGEVRACLDAKKSEVTAACKTALDTTGRGQGRKQ